MGSPHHQDHDAGRGQMVPLKQHYDPTSSRWSPSYDPNYGNRGSITGRDTYDPPKER